jgi:hypothetical protein
MPKPKSNVLKCEHVPAPDKICRNSECRKGGCQKLAKQKQEGEGKKTT